MSGLARQCAALVVAIVMLAGCGVRVSLGEYDPYFVDADGGMFPPDERSDAEAIDPRDEHLGNDPLDASDDALDDAPPADALGDRARDSVIESAAPGKERAR